MNLFSELKEMNILLIDDDEWIRDSMSLFFEGEGCPLLALETAEEGIEELDRKSYDILFIDYKLPGMDGLQFLERIKKSQPNILKVLITAYGIEVFNKANKLGIHDFITKPFTSEDIQKVSYPIDKKTKTSELDLYIRLTLALFMMCSQLIMEEKDDIIVAGK